jgi:hypothetical protein
MLPIDIGYRRCGIEPRSNDGTTADNYVEDDAMARAMGIELGIADSVIAAVQGGQPGVLPNAEGSRTTSLTPSSRPGDWR